MVIYLVRHGKDEETVRGGWSRQPLTNTGVKQAERLAKFVKENQAILRIRHIYSSDLPRAMETANQIGKGISLPVMPAPQFREVNNGELAGMKNALALERYPGLFWNQLEWEQCYPSGESPRQFTERIESAWNDFAQQQNENVLLVTHAGVMQVIRAVIGGENYSNRGKYPKIDYCQMIALHNNGNCWEEIEV